MPGAHSDVGGGYREDFLSKVALLTMLERITEHTTLKIGTRFRRKLEDNILSTLDDAVTPQITLNRETQLHWRATETFQDGWRIPQRGKTFEHLHPICRLMTNRLIRRKGIKKHEVYCFPECGLPEAPFKQLLERLASRRDGGIADTSGGDSAR